MHKWLLLAAISFVVDRLTKWWVVDNFALHERVDLTVFFALVRWHNEGAAFSFLASAGGWQRWFFVTLGVGFSIFVLYELRRLSATERAMGVVYGLILGGALGNLVDRVWHGYVVDFLLFHYEQNYFPAFNIADSSLFCGAVLWIWLMLNEWRTQRQEASKVE